MYSYVKLILWLSVYETEPEENNKWGGDDSGGGSDDGDIKKKFSTLKIPIGIND